MRCEEGNDHVLRDFDAAISTSSRPGLITHLAISSIGLPVGSFGAAAHVVDNMVFDPVLMCCMSTLLRTKMSLMFPLTWLTMKRMAKERGKVTPSVQVNPYRALTLRSHPPQMWVHTRLSDASRMQSLSLLASTHMWLNSEPGSERGSRASIVFDVDDNFVDLCCDAESRHCAETRGLSGQGKTLSVKLMTWW